MLSKPKNSTEMYTRNNLVDNPKNTVCKELTASACLFGKENIQSQSRDIAKGQNKMQN